MATRSLRQILQRINSRTAVIFTLNYDYTLFQGPKSSRTPKSQVCTSAMFLYIICKWAVNWWQWLLCMYIHMK